MDSGLITALFLIFFGAAVLSTVALLTRQSMLVAYMVLGVLLGPWCLGWINDANMVRNVGSIGIIFLLFLLGLHLPPQKLLQMLKKVSLVGVVSSIVFSGTGFLVAYWFGFNVTECCVIGAAMMFSSTIIGIKLLPTTVLHHQHTGEVMISVLLFQDLIAIIVLLAMKAASGGGGLDKEIGTVMLGFPALLLSAFVLERYALYFLFKKFSRIKEYLFLIAIGWCLLLAEFAAILHLSDEIGAFIAGVSLAASPISVYIAESLKPVRDFFLVMFFFSVGASFNLNYIPGIYIPALILTVLMLSLKPLVYRYLLGRVNETPNVSWEVGFRLGQISEFSLIIASVGMSSNLIMDRATCLIQAITILTFVVSSYVVVMNFPTPVSLSDKLRRD